MTLYSKLLLGSIMTFFNCSCSNFSRGIDLGVKTAHEKQLSREEVFVEQVEDLIYQNSPTHNFYKKDYKFFIERIEKYNFDEDKKVYLCDALAEYYESQRDQPVAVAHFFYTMLKNRWYDYELIEHFRLKGYNPYNCTLEDVKEYLGV